MTDSLTQEAVVQRTPVYERLRQTKMTLAKHLVLGLVVGRQVGKGKGLVDKEKWSGEESLSGSETPPGSSCARKVFFALYYSTCSPQYAFWDKYCATSRQHVFLFPSWQRCSGGEAEQNPDVVLSTP